MWGQTEQPRRRSNLKKKKQLQMHALDLKYSENTSLQVCKQTWKDPSWPGSLTQQKTFERFVCCGSLFSLCENVKVYSRFTDCIFFLFFTAKWCTTDGNQEEMTMALSWTGFLSLDEGYVLFFFGFFLQLCHSGHSSSPVCSADVSENTLARVNPHSLQT